MLYKAISLEGRSDIEKPTGNEFPVNVAGNASALTSADLDKEITANSTAQWYNNHSVKNMAENTKMCASTDDVASISSQTTLENEGFRLVQGKRNKNKNKNKKRKGGSGSDGDSDYHIMRLESTLAEQEKTIARLEEQNKHLINEIAAIRSAQNCIVQSVSVAMDTELNRNEWSAEAARSSAQREKKEEIAQPARNTGAIPKRRGNIPTERGNQQNTTQRDEQILLNDATQQPTVMSMANPTNGAGEHGRGVDGAIKGKTSPPVIKVHNVNVKQLADKIRNELGHDLFSINIIGRAIVNVKLNRVEDHEKVKKLLEKDNISFFTYTPKDQKPYTFMIRGLSETYDESDLQGFIAERGLNITVNRMVKLGGDRWILQLSSDSDAKAFKKIQYFLNSKVRIGKHKNKGLIQCRNCQRFGHISTNCGMPFRCVKCSLSHGPANCQIPSKEYNTEEKVVMDPVTGERTIIKGKPVRCANCDMEGHVASAKNCPKREELMRKMKNKQTPKTMIPVQYYSRTAVPTTIPPNGASYAAVARPPPRVANANVPPPTEIMGQINQAMGMFDTDCKRLLGKDFFTCMQRIGAYAETYRQLKTEGEKSKALMGLLMSLKLYD